MNDISALDKNFAYKAFSENGIVYRDIRMAPFSVYGIEWDDEVGYVRVPNALAIQIREQFAQLNRNVAGGRIRFRTDSDEIYVKCKISGSWRMTHMADAGSAGLDVYEVVDGKQKFLCPILPQKQTSDEWTERAKIPAGEHDIILNLPIFTSFTEILVGVKEGSHLSEGGKYKYEKPIVFYGSSITHGACASRPGNIYENMISRRFDTNYVNLGYSGNAKGEKPLMDYIAGLEMSIFVLDYDHNARDPEYLDSTHYAAYRTVRDAQPSLPIIMVTRPDYDKPGDSGKPYRDVVARTYEKALAEGDGNVYFVDGEKEFSTFVSDGLSVDGSHPNDLGFALMAQKIGDVIANLL